MKHHVLSFLLMLVGAMQMQATDIIYGNCHYREIEGRYAGYRKTESYTTFETDDRITLVYCLRIPRDSVAGYAVLTPKVTGDITLNVRVKDCETDEVLLEQSVTQACTKSSNASLEIIPKMKFPSDTWYRVEIQAPSGYNLISRLIRLEFERNGSRPVLDAHLRGFPTPATNLWFGHSTAPNAPQNESYEWCYQEVLMPKEYATINTYLMTLGITGGYIGIQMCGQTVGTMATRTLRLTWRPTSGQVLWLTATTSPSTALAMKELAVSRWYTMADGILGSGCSSLLALVRKREPL